MCGVCGCGETDKRAVQVEASLLAANDHEALHNRQHFLETGVLALNLMGSPGAGKTALLEATAKRLGGERLCAMSGDLATDHDGARLRAAGVPSLTITTGTACHLDARVVHQALHQLPWQGKELLFIENVGNLVCPAIYDLGQAANVVALSVTEGEDKPVKYPVMFHRADLVVLTKADLLPHLPMVSVERVRESLAKTMPEPRMIVLSALTGEGMDEWLAWLAERRTQLPRVDGGPSHHHHAGDPPGEAHAHQHGPGDHHHHHDHDHDHHHE